MQAKRRQRPGVVNVGVMVRLEAGKTAIIAYIAAQRNAAGSGLEQKAWSQAGPKRVEKYSR